MVLAMGMTGAWNIDEARKARESLPALVYWPASYYEMRFYALVDQLLQLGLITAEEQATGRMSSPPKPLRRVPTAGMVPAILNAGGPASRPSNTRPGFSVGDKVRTRNINPEGHTRLPRYARDKTGEIASVHGTHVFPDSSGNGKGEDPQWLYTVRISARELWGSNTRDAVYLDLWEPHLEVA
jgi:nitrile hydratase